MGKLKTAVVGLGYLGTVYARVLNDLPQSELVAVCSRTSSVVDELSRELEVKGYADYQKMLRDSDSEVVFIATPQGSHMKLAVEAMKAGKHVYCTKPMATSLKEADAMINVSRETDKKLEIGFHFRYDEYIKRIRDIVRTGQIGRVTSTISSVQQHRDTDYWTQGKWRASLQQAGGGVLMTNYSHDIDFLYWFFGDASWVFGYVDTLVHPIEVEDYANGMVKFKKGVVSSLNFSTGSWRSYSPRLEVFGTKGALTLVDKKDSSWKSIGTALYLFKENESQKVDIKQSARMLRKWSGRLLPWTVPLTGLSSIHSLISHFSDFLQSILLGGDNTIDGVEGRKSLEVAIAIYKSSEKGKRIMLPLR